MKIVIQRVQRASVTIEGTLTDSINAGMLILLGVEASDTVEDIEWLAGKTARLRIFEDEAGVMNRDITEFGGEVMVVSQFTLHA